MPSGAQTLAKRSCAHEAAMYSRQPDCVTFGGVMQLPQREAVAPNPSRFFLCCSFLSQLEVFEKRGCHVHPQ